jgi:fructose-specific phosphotransferase system IIC component
MDEIIKSQCENAIVKLTFIFATFGLLAALLLAMLLFGFIGLGTFTSRFLASFIAAIVGLYAAALFFGKIASRLINENRNTNLKLGVIGVGVAWGCLLVSVLAGSSVEFFAEIKRSPSLSQAFFDYIFKPLFWVMLFGIIPALFLGRLYATRLRKLLQEYK